MKGRDGDTRNECVDGMVMSDVDGDDVDGVCCLDHLQIFEILLNNDLFRRLPHKLDPLRIGCVCDVYIDLFRR